jgi:hypothetical protein
LCCKEFPARLPNFPGAVHIDARVPASGLRLTRSAPRIGTPTPRTDELGFLSAIVGSRVGENATASKSESRRDDRGLHSQPAYLGRTGLHDEGYPGQSPEGTGKISEAASRSSWNGAGTLRAGRGLMECRTGHSAGGSAEMPPPPDEAATTGRQTDPGPPKGSRRSAVSAMARLRLPRRSLRPGRAKCARSGPSPSATMRRCPSFETDPRSPPDELEGMDLLQPKAIGTSRTALR